MSESVAAKLKIGITGSSGLIGSALLPHLRVAGNNVFSLPKTRASGVLVVSEEDRSAPLLDAVIHLAGEPIGNERWTVAKRDRIRDSRIAGTSALCNALAQLEHPPRVIVSASAIGYYGNRGDEILDENSPAGIGFLPEVVQAWEEATAPAAQRGIRVACLRFGMVLSRHGGALAKMLSPFRWGLGGRLGTGKQFWSWIAIDDVLRVIDRVLADATLAGPINCVTPQPVRNSEFTHILGRTLRRPTLAPVPAWGVRTLFGQMGDELLLASARVTPRRLIENGFAFQYERLEDVLEHLLSDMDLD